MDRDFVGYQMKLPKVLWPNQARIALNFVLNYEEGSERNVLDGDNQSENYLTDWPLISPKEGRHFSSESLFEYGSRVGVWRLLSLFDENNLPITLFATGLALERNSALAEKLKGSWHEVAGHGYRWIDYSSFDPELEKEHIDKTISIIENLTQKKMTGWYTGRCSPNTRKLIVKAGIKYDSDSYADEIPFWVPVLEKIHLVIPYNLDTNDARYTTSPGWNTGNDFFQHLKATFDCLYREGAANPKMMTVGLHARISGRPGRCEALRNFIEYTKQFDKLWICKREEIAAHWYQMYEN